MVLAVIGIVGVGEMGSAIAAGLIKAGRADELLLIAKNQHAVGSLQQLFPGVAVSASVPDDADVILAVKPKDTLGVLGDLRPRRVVSVAAGISLAALQQAAGDDAVVARAMPNIGAQVGQSATAFCASPSTADDHIQWVHDVLRAFGTVVRVDESQMDAVTGLSGSGVAYMFLVLEAMIEAGVAEGLDPDDAHALAVATMRGAAAYASTTDESPAELRAKVTTPNGTTIEGLKVLEGYNIRGLFRVAVRAATVRSRKIGKSLQ
jgi:pyrroline-5-carboxylate reductase